MSFQLLRPVALFLPHRQPVVQIDWIESLQIHSIICASILQQCSTVHPFIFCSLSYKSLLRRFQILFLPILYSIFFSFDFWYFSSFLIVFHPILFNLSSGSRFCVHPIISIKTTSDNVPYYFFLSIIHKQHLSVPKLTDTVTSNFFLSIVHKSHCSPVPDSVPCHYFLSIQSSYTFCSPGPRECSILFFSINSWYAVYSTYHCSHCPALR